MMGLFWTSNYHRMTYDAQLKRFIKLRAYHHHSVIILLSLISFCRSFTATELIKCRDPAGRLVNEICTPNKVNKDKHRKSYSISSTKIEMGGYEKAGEEGDDAGVGEDFFEAILSQENSELSKYTHMIGIPLEENHDLLLELESVQRAILHNCPALLSSCIVPVMTRMPLLYVDTVTSSGGLNANRGEDITKILDSIVREVLDKYIFNVTALDNQKEQTEGKSVPMGGRNNDGIQPLMMTFQGLELDGDKCEVLHVVGNYECDGTKLLRSILADIRTKVEARGWNTIFPPDNPQGKSKTQIQLDRDNWRPRVPFMRLPNNFYQTLPPLPEGRDDSFGHLPEEGGNGISPILWYKWWEDEFTKDDGIRLREIAIYRRSGPWGLSEKAFYMPTTKLKLPHGNDVLTKSEANDKDYANNRLKEQIGEQGAALEMELSQQIADAQQQYASALKSSSTKTTNHDVIDNTQTKLDTIMDQITNHTQNIQTTNTSSSQSSIPPKKDLQNIDFDNDEGIQKIRNMLKKTPTPAHESLPDQEQQQTPNTPYPSDEHFVGIWRLVSSPIKNSDVTNILRLPNSASDNILLRVDGGIAGGPTLNQRDNQKAAGGNWKWFQARWAGGGDTQEIEQTRLRIRLLIPPEKNELLVMEGKVTRVMMPRGSQDLSFGAIFNDDDRDQASKDQLFKKSHDSFLYCDGEVWVQDIEGTGKRTKLGMFTATKLDTPRQGSIKYTVPSTKLSD